MIKYGTPASKGYAAGHIYLKKETELIIESGPCKDIAAEVLRLKKAQNDARAQLTELRNRTAIELGESDALIFDTHMMFLDDPDFMGAVEQEITESGKNAMEALAHVTKSFLQVFNLMDDEYMRERAADVKDVSDRMLRILAGHVQQIVELEENTIVAAHDLTPSDTANLDKSKVIAFITDIGGRTSHTAIMARSLEIPAVVGMGTITRSVRNGDFVIVDGNRGEVIINPDEATIGQYEKLRAEYLKELAQLEKFRDVETKSRDGKRIEVSANIGRTEDVHAAIENGADGIGLFRTEFLYMDRDDLPPEEEQFEAYRYVLEKMKNKPVIIRTLDIGGDKRLPYLPMPEEMNPFLGYRAIRLCLDRPELFKVQLRALLRASIYGNLKVMFPMISGIGEYRAAMKFVEECKAELDKEGIAYSPNIKWGSMVEIPSVAVIADQIAEEADFLSIGTNDLIQYTLACDRMSEKVSYLYDPMHPAVLRLIKMTIEGAHSKGKWCGMCGEMAGDEESIPGLLAMGLDEFSMAAASMLRAKQIILENDSDLKNSAVQTIVEPAISSK